MSDFKDYELNGKTYEPDDNPRFDGEEAINVSRTKDIPVDYEGPMGVPLTFLDKWSSPCPR